MNNLFLDTDKVRVKMKRFIDLTLLYMYSINIYCLITFINYQVICLQEEAVAYIAIISGLMLLCQRKAILIESIS